MIEDLPLLPAALRGDLGQPDRGLHRLDLTEEGPDVAEPMGAPVPQEPRRLRRLLPSARIGKLRHRSTRWRTPPMNAVRSYCCASVPRACVASSKTILLPCATLLRLPDRRDERDLATFVAHLVRRLAAWVEPQWRDGYSYGEFRSGCPKKVGSILRQVNKLNASRVLHRQRIGCAPNRNGLGDRASRSSPTPPRAQHHRRSLTQPQDRPELQRRGGANDHG